MKNVMCKNTEEKNSMTPPPYIFFTGPKYQPKNYQWIFLEKGICLEFYLGSYLRNRGGSLGWKSGKEGD